MDEFHRHGGINWSRPGACPFCRVQDLEAENTRLKASAVPLIKTDNSAVIARLEEENARLRDALKEIINISDRKHVAWDKAKELLQQEG